MANSKLQIKPGARVALLSLPDGVELELPEGATIVPDPAGADVVIAFAADSASLGAVADPAVTAARDDRLAWIAYPKAGQLGTDLNRDRLAGLVIERGAHPVRQVSIDGVWSAIRFRP